MAFLHNLVIMGASTGGPATVREVFTDLPDLRAAIVLVQHMPKYINLSLQQALSKVTKMRVKIAENEDPLEPGCVYVAPSELHCKVKLNKTLVLEAGEKVNSVCPAVDTAMLSVQKDASRKLVSIILTGMGEDGAAGLAHMKDAGATTIAQERSSCVISGMPDAAVKTGKVDLLLPPEKIREKLIELFRKS